MDIAVPLGTEIESVDFGFLTTKDIKRLSVKQITTPDVFDNLGHPIAGGLYDLALGAFLKNMCTTCGLDDRFCPGHVGHIELPLPVYNPMFFSLLYTFLRSSCLYCHKFRLKDLETHLYTCKLKLLQHGLVHECSVIQNFRLDNNVDVELSEAEEGEEDEAGLGSKKPNADSDASAHLQMDDLKSRREHYVKESIKKAIKEGRSTETGVHTSAILEERRRCVHEFYQKLLARPKCDNCGMFSPKYRKDGVSKIFEMPLTDKQVTNNRIKGGQRQHMVFESKKATAEDSEYTVPGLNSIPAPKAKGTDSSRYVLSIEVRNGLRALFSKEKGIVDILFQMHPGSKEKVSADMFFIHSVVVPPTRFRLPSQLGDEVHASPQNELLAKVLTTSLRIRDLNDEYTRLVNAKIGGEERKNVFTQLMNNFVTIQTDVNSFLDSTKNPSTQGGKSPLPGVKQALEKKEGLFRKNMMGKRVNYAARSVISPDPNIETNEIGVPPVFAVKLTYPEPVTAYNFEEMRRAVINGPNIWPGATQVQNEDGSFVSLLNMTLEQRTAVANQLMTPSSSVGFQSVVNKKVFRHINNHDVVLMNRQPTLHKASMMGHKVRVLPGEKTLRMHYANTGSYNADFDGDEMNMHFPQNEGARAEAFLLANTDSQYLTPTSGKPLRGLIQDHISAGIWLTNKDTLFTREQYQQLVYGSIRPEDGHATSGKIITVPPAVLKPAPMWTGKQVITTVLLNVKPVDRPGLNLVSKNKVKNEYWGAGSKENEVLFRNGELLCGVLDKSQYGASDYGLVHSVHEIYGAYTSGILLSVLGRLFTKYIMSIGFTCGMDDLWLTPEGNKWRKDIIDNSKDIGLKAAVEVANLPEGTKADDPELQRRLEEILRDDSKLAILDAIAQNKVGTITSGVISKCIPEGTDKRFPQNNMQQMALSGAKGSNVNVSQIMCMLGQQALEGRRVPVMVSGKTLPSFKPFETEAIAGGYIAGRFFSGIKPQEYYFHCMAGREGLIDTAVKTSRSGYLQRCLIKKLEGVATQYDNTVRDSDGSLVQFMYGGDAVDVVKESYLQKFEFCAENYESLLQKHQPKNSVEYIDTDSAIEYSKKIRKHIKKHPEDSDKFDPTLAIYSPSKHLGSVSEAFEQKLENFIKQNQHLFPEKKDKKNKGGITEKKFRSLMQLKYIQSVVNPGEAVGIIASQSIGEPSTQMTLNTFHFAGHGAANVTLGIPRMREIIMTASANIKTPQMILPILPEISDENADVFCRGVTRIVLSEIIDNVVVTESVGLNANDAMCRTYTARLKFFAQNEYEQEYDVSKEGLQKVVADSFLKDLEKTVIKELKKQGKLVVADVGSAVPTNRAGNASKDTEESRDSSARAANNDGGDDDDDEDDDEDMNSDAEDDDSAKKLGGKQAISYDAPDDDELDVMEQAQKSSEDEGDGSMSESDSDSDSDSDSVEVSDSDAEMEEAQKTALSDYARARQQDIVGRYQSIRSYNFDDKNGEWCEFSMEFSANTKKVLMVNIIETLCRKLVVKEVPNISRCIRPPKHNDGRVLVTEGVNFKAMWDEDLFIDVNGILSNDVSAVLKSYGVEAARSTIVREISNVFQTYAISVNLRHLDLIADVMTREGTYLPFNRQGVDASTSPFLKMSFETTCNFLTNAVINGDKDTLDSPSARIVVGRMSKVGTGSFDVFTPIMN